MFDIDYLTDSMNYIPVSLDNQAKPHAGTSTVTNHAGTSEVTNNAGTLNTNASEEEDAAEELIIVPTAVQHTTEKKEASPKGISEDAQDILAFRKEFDAIAQKNLGAALENNTTSTPSVNTGNGSVNTGKFDASQHPDTDDSDMPELQIFNKPKQGIFDAASCDEEGVVTDFNNLPTEVVVSPIPTLRINNFHPQSQILGDPKSFVQTRSREEPKKIFEALQDDSWVEAMQEELLQFRLQQVWILVDLPHGAKVIGTKWVYRNKRDERGVVVRNKARLVAQGHRHEEGIDYDNVFALVARIEVIRLFLAFASFMGFIVYQMDVKSAFLYGTIDEEVYVSQPPGFVDPGHPKKVYKVVKALYGLHQAPKAWYATLSTFLEEYGYRRGTIDKTLFIKKDKKEYAWSSIYKSTLLDMLKKFDLASVKTTITPMETKMALTKGHSQDSQPNTVGEISLSTLWQTHFGAYGILELISWQCKKQTIVVTSTTEAEYVAAASCCGQVLWIQNQMLDYGFNFMNTKIYIDNESTICIVKNPVYHSKTKHIEIRHHFIRETYEKKLIRVEKIHTDFNVADLLTKAFDGQ
ncbi:copia protein [Tanacetum coccineum]